MQWHTGRIYRRLVFVLLSSWNLQNSATVVLLGPKNISMRPFSQMLNDPAIYLHRSWEKSFVGLLAQVCSAGFGDILPFLSAGPFKFLQVRCRGGLPSSLRAGVLCIWQTDVSVHVAFPSSLNRSRWPSHWKTPRQHGQERQTWPSD